MMEFTPKESEQVVPYYEDATTEEGWAGHRTDKSLKTLQSEVTQAMSRLGASVISFMRGTYGEGSKKSREGYLITYEIKGMRGQIKIAALPVKPPSNSSGQHRKWFEGRQEKSLKMALFMFRQHVEGMWFAEQMSPGYFPLTPFMLDERSGMTISEIVMRNNIAALPESTGGDAVDAEFTEAGR
ncbi:hypothetical protein KQH61_06090 [bacterium]|nr:hypothetical protein [bacterium]